MSALTERDRRLLRALVRAYIDNGEPISSLWLAEHGSFGLSSATVRNVLSRLEELGYVRQPHTSAGRVPTDRGYRLHVDQLLTLRRTPRPAADVEARLRKSGTVVDRLADVSQELSRASHHIGFALKPADETSTFHHIDFVPLGAGRILVVVVATGGQITHKVITLDEQVTGDELLHAANYLNTEFSGLSLVEVRAAILQRMQEERALYDSLMARALKLGREGLDQVVPENTLIVQGASLLLHELNEEDAAPAIETLRALLHMIEDKHRLVRLLSKYIDASGLTVVIGSEHSVPDLQQFSLVASTYSDGQRSGTVGVIGPTRMRYSRAISLVEAVAGALSRVLDSERTTDPASLQ